MAVRNDFTAGEVLAAADLNDTFASKLDLAGGKILQIVRATNTADFSTTSTSPVDVTGMSVTISPQKPDSAVIIIVSCRVGVSGNDYVRFRVTDASNNVVGGQGIVIDMPNLSGSRGNMNIFAYATPATTNATTYKLRVQVDNSASSALIENAQNTGQLYAIEVSA
jgi:hypothetical protein